MVLDSLHPEIRDALVACCSLRSFDRSRFDQLVTEYRLEQKRAVLLDEVYQAVVFADCDRRRQERRLRRRWRRSNEPSMN